MLPPRRTATGLLGLSLAACSPAPPPPTTSSATLAPDPATAVTPRGSEVAPPATERSTPSASASASASVVCAPSGDWQGCVDQVSRVVGTKAKLVQQHPSSGALPLPGSKPLVDDYLDVDGRQIVVVLEKVIDCPGRVEVVGRLVAVGLGGPAGTKSSYSGFRLEQATARCL